LLGNDATDEGFKRVDFFGEAGGGEDTAGIFLNYWFEFGFGFDARFWLVFV